MAAFLTPEGFSQPSVAAVLREGRSSPRPVATPCAALGPRGARRRTPLGARPARRGRAGAAGAGLPRRRLLAGADEPDAAPRRASAPTARTSAPTSAARSPPPPSSRSGSRRSPQRRGSRVRIVGHSLGGMLARGVAARRPDLVAGHRHDGQPDARARRPPRLAGSQRRHAGAAQPGRRARPDGRGLRGRRAARGRASTRRGRRSAEGVDFTAIYSRRDGIVDWRACIDPAAVPVEVRVVARGHGVRPRASSRAVSAALRPPAADCQWSKSIVERSRSFESGARR